MNIPIHCTYTDLADPTTLVPNPCNPNQHPKRQIELLAKIISTQGWRAPITVSNQSGFVVRGHGRLQAALLLGVDKVPIDRQDYKSDADEWADLVADNRIAELANIDDTELAKLLQDIGNTDLDINLTGYTDKQIDNLLADVRAEAVTEDNFDVAAEIDNKHDSTAQLGDVFQLGRHRLMCGDSTCTADVQKLMDRAQANMIFTDPPYNVNYEGGTKDKLKIKNDNMPEKEFNEFLTSVFFNAYDVSAAGAAIYVCHADGASSDFRAALKNANWTIKQCLIWVKNQFVLGRQDYQWQHEPILYGWKPGAAHAWYGGRKRSTVIDDDVPIVIKDEGTHKLILFNTGLRQVVIKATDAEIISSAGDDLSTIWRIEKPQRNGEHPTMKPIALCARAIQNSSKSDDIVLDLFAGSGSTLMAAEQTNRICYAMEYDPIYVDVIIKRWETFTGKKAVKLS